MDFSNVETVAIMVALASIVVFSIPLFALIARLMTTTRVLGEVGADLIATDEKRIEAENRAIAAEAKAKSRETEYNSANAAYNRESTERSRLATVVSSLNTDKFSLNVQLQNVTVERQEFQTRCKVLEDKVAETSDTLGKRITILSDKLKAKEEAYTRVVYARNRAADSYNTLYDAYWGLAKKVAALAGAVGESDAGIEPKFGPLAGQDIDAGDFVGLDEHGLVRPIKLESGDPTRFTGGCGMPVVEHQMQAGLQVPKHWVEEQLGIPEKVEVYKEAPLDPTIPGECLGASLTPSGEVNGFISRDEAGKLSVVG